MIGNKKLKNIQLIFFDFDGVLTNNTVSIDEDGIESVTCNRSDGLAFNAINKLNLRCFVLSTEKNKVVSARCKKLNTKCIQGVDNKLLEIKKISKELNIDKEGIMYIGNDINDLEAIQYVGHSACPSDSHDLVKLNCKYILKKNGGEGIARELIERILKIDIVKLLYQ